MQNLEFLSTVSAEEFKAAKGVSKIEILRNESTGKCFFAYGKEKGAVTNKFPATKLTEPVISEVLVPDTGEKFYLLHNKSESKVMKLGVI